MSLPVASAPIRGGARQPARRGHASLVLAGALLSVGVWPRPAAALDPRKPFEHHAHDAWPSVAHASTIYTIQPSSQGQLWLGTSAGLVHFDGTHMSTFEARDPRGAFDQNVRAIIQADDGTVWVGTSGRGIHRLAGHTVEPISDGRSSPGRHVFAFVRYTDGSLWAAGQDGVARLDPGSGNHFIDRSQGLPHRRTLVLAVDAQGVLWAGTHAGLARLEGQTWQVESGAGLRPPAVSINALLAEPTNTLWVGTRTDGLWRRDPSGWHRFGIDAGLGSDRITAIFRDRAGVLWVASHGGHLAWLDGNRFRRFTLPDKLCGDRILALAQDFEGGLWIGTELCGLHRLADRPFSTLTRADGLPGDLVLGLGQGRDGSAWVGTRGHGMARIPPAGSPITPLPCSPDLPCDECWDFSPSPKGGPAFRTVCRTNVVLAWDGSAMTRLEPLPAGLPAASFALETADGAVWYALEKKVVRAHAGAVEVIAGLERSEGYRILFEGKDGAVWVATDDALLRWREGRTRLWRLPASERPAEVANFHEDEAGTLWMATKGEGIRRLRRDGREIATVGVAQGLPTGFVVQVLEDGEGRVWASSSKGIFWVKKRELEAAATGRLRRVETSLYDANDGIHMWSQSYGHPAGFKDAEGRLWFATNGGVVIVDPPAWTAAPRVQVDRVRLAGAPIALDRPAVATAGGQRELEVEFSALTFSRPDTVSFRYRLRREGEADEAHGWIDLGKSRSLYHPALEPGRYRLVLEARTRESDFGSNGTTFAFTLRPPFLRSPAFGMLVALAAALGLFGLYRVRLARVRAGLQAILAERTRIARDMHDTLAQAFVATSVQLECLEEALEGNPDDPNTRAKIERHLSTARKVVTESLEEARDAVWVLRPQAIEPGLVPALETLVRRTSGATPIAFQVSGQVRDLPPLVASNLLRIAQEAVANAHRHAQAKRITLDLRFAPRSVSLTVQDDGKGVPSDPPANRASRPGGLRGMQERAAQMKGRLAMNSTPGQGTSITVEVTA